MNKTSPDLSILTARIRRAFAGVKLGDGVSLRQTQVIDRYGDGLSDADFAALPAEEITDDWSQLTLSDINCDCIAHLDAAGFRYYIPALMLSVLSHYDPTSMRVIGTIQGLYPKAPHAEHRERIYSLLDESQRSAIAAFLNALPGLVHLSDEDKKCVARSLQNYWGGYLSGTAPNPRLERP